MSDSNIRICGGPYACPNRTFDEMNVECRACADEVDLIRQMSQAECWQDVYGSEDSR